VSSLINNPDLPFSLLVSVPISHCPLFIEPHTVRLCLRLLSHFYLLLLLNLLFLLNQHWLSLIKCIIFTELFWILRYHNYLIRLLFFKLKLLLLLLLLLQPGFLLFGLLNNCNLFYLLGRLLITKLRSLSR
jgi:hypothetical protein